MNKNLHQENVFWFYKSFHLIFDVRKIEKVSPKKKQSVGLATKLLSTNSIEKNEYFPNCPHLHACMFVLNGNPVEFSDPETSTDENCSKNTQTLESSIVNQLLIEITFLFHPVRTKNFEQIVISGVFVRIKDKNLHVECFKCATCGTSLKNQGYFNLHNKLYCDIHARMAALNSPPPNAAANGLVPVTFPP